MTREEAIKIIESNCSCTDSKLREACAMFIPELAESEDEWIRKHIIKILDNLAPCHWDGNEKARCIAYLEKQKEQKPAEWSEIEQNVIDCAVDVLEKELPSLAASLKSLRSSWKPSEDQIQALYNILRDPKNAGSISDRASIVGLIHDLKKLK